MVNKYRLFVVDDEPDLLEIYVESMKDQFEIIAFEKPMQAVKAIDDGQKVDILITDYRMADMNGLELIAEVRQRVPDLPVILISAYADKDRALQALSLGVFDLVEKPFSMLKLRNTLKRACSQVMMEELCVDLNQKFSELSLLVEHAAEQHHAPELKGLAVQIRSSLKDFLHRRTVLKELRNP